MSMVIGTINPYQYTTISPPKINKHDHPKIGCKKFGFRDRKGIRYIVEVDIYEHNAYAVKFYAKHHSSSPFKYNLLTYHWDARKIIETCVQIGVDLHKQNEYISFCFIGSPTQDEFIKTKYDTTKRFRVYSMISKFLLNPDTFTHMDDSGKSFYILLNNKAKEKDPDLFNKIKKMFETNYNVTNFFPDLEQLKRTQSMTRATMGRKTKKQR